MAFGDQAKQLQHRSEAGELSKGQKVSLIGYQHTRQVRLGTRDGGTKMVIEIYAVAVTLARHRRRLTHPILMKKERPAPTLSALVRASETEEARRAIFTQTTTLGVWENWVAKVAKRALDREALTVAVDGRPVRVKVGRLPDGTVVTA